MRPRLMPWREERRPWPGWTLASGSWNMSLMLEIGAALIPRRTWESLSARIKKQIEEAEEIAALKLVKYRKNNDAGAMPMLMSKLLPRPRPGHVLHLFHLQVNRKMYTFLYNLLRLIISSMVECQKYWFLTYHKFLQYSLSLSKFSKMHYKMGFCWSNQAKSMKWLYFGK